METFTKIKTWLEGRKTYLVFAAFIIVVLVTGKVPEGMENYQDAILGVNPDAFKEALLGLAGITFKAAFDRFVKSQT